MSRKTVIFAFLLFFVFDACVTLAEEKIRDETTHAKVDAMFGNWRAITPEILRAPENAAVIEELKRIADRSPASIAVVLLLRQGDEQTVQRSLAQVRAESPRDRDSAARDLSSAANPSIIRLLERDLNKEESPKWIRFEDVVILPPSMAAASIIKATILESPVFSPSVKEWARSLPQVSAGLRDGVRVWWKVNKAAVERGDYQSVVPVEVVTDTLTVLPDVTATPTQSTPIATPPRVASLPVQTVVDRRVPAEHRARVWPWVVGILALVLVAALALKRRV